MKVVRGFWPTEAVTSEVVGGPCPAEVVRCIFKSMLPLEVVRGGVVARLIVRGSCKIEVVSP